MYKKWKKMEKKYVILIGTLGLVLVLGIIITTLRDERKLNPVEKIVKDSGLFVEKILFTPIHFIQEKIEEQKEKQNLYEKYKELEQAKEEIDSVNAKNEELARELRQLKEVLELNETLDQYSYFNATIINRNLGYWHNTVTIDKGEVDGVQIDMPVIVKNGLVGKVIKTSYFNSTVKLLTTEDINNKISVRIQIGEEFVYGLLTSYNIEKHVFIVEGMDTNKTISVGSVVTTTGLGDIFPSGILIGKVKNITTDSFDLAKTLEVESAVDFDNISFVTILKRDV